MTTSESVESALTRVEQLVRNREVELDWVSCRLEEENQELSRLRPNNDDKKAELVSSVNLIRVLREISSQWQAMSREADAALSLNRAEAALYEQELSLVSDKKTFLEMKMGGKI